MLYFYQCAFNLEKFVQNEDEVYETSVLKLLLLQEKSYNMQQAPTTRFTLIIRLFPRTKYSRSMNRICELDTQF